MGPPWLSLSPWYSNAQQLRFSAAPVGETVSNHYPYLSALLTATPLAGEFTPRYSKNDNYRDPNGEIFAETRDTEGDSVATADGNEADTHKSSLNEVGAFADQGLDPSLSTPVAVLPSTQARCGGGAVAGRAEEWCAGHVCLRLRPDGLREKSVDRGEAEDHESSDDGPESGSGSEESGEREVRLYVHSLARGLVVATVRTRTTRNKVVCTQHIKQAPTD